MENTLLFNVEGMTCGGCVRAVTTALESVPGVTPLHVMAGHPVEVSVSDASQIQAAIEKAIEEVGFKAVFNASASHGLN